MRHAPCSTLSHARQSPDAHAKTGRTRAKAPGFRSRPALRHATLPKLTPPRPRQLPRATLSTLPGRRRQPSGPQRVWPRPLGAPSPGVRQQLSLCQLRLPPLTLGYPSTYSGWHALASGDIMSPEPRVSPLASVHVHAPARPMACTWPYHSGWQLPTGGLSPVGRDTHAACIPLDWRAILVRPSTTFFGEHLSIFGLF